MDTNPIKGLVFEIFSIKFAPDTQTQYVSTNNKGRLSLAAARAKKSKPILKPYMHFSYSAGLLSIRSIQPAVIAISVESMTMF